MKILRYAPLAALAAFLIFKIGSTGNIGSIEITGDRIPPGKDPSIL